MSLKITSLKLLPYLPGANELMAAAKSSVAKYHRGLAGVAVSLHLLTHRSLESLS